MTNTTNTVAATTTTRLFKVYRTTYANLAAMYTDLATGLVSYATDRGIALPMSVESVEIAADTDLRYSNSAMERTVDAVADIVATIGRRLPSGESLDLITLDDSGAVTVLHTAG